MLSNIIDKMSHAIYHVILSKANNNDESRPDPDRKKYVYLEVYSKYEWKPDEKCVFFIIDEWLVFCLFAW